MQVDETQISQIKKSVSMERKLFHSPIVKSLNHANPKHGGKRYTQLKSGKIRTINLPVTAII